MKILFKEQSFQIIGACFEVCYGEIILEIKVVKQLADEHRAQMTNYLKATGMQLGLLVQVPLNTANIAMIVGGNPLPPSSPVFQCRHRDADPRIARVVVTGI